MQKARWTTLLLLCVPLSPAAYADAVTSYGADISRASLDAYIARTGLSRVEYSAHWRVPRPVETMAFYNESAAAMSSLDFQDPGAFARVVKLRELSLLTLAEVGTTRLFFGVSETGLLGIHLAALPGFDDERCLEVARMPYLKDTRSGDSTE